MERIVPDFKILNIIPFFGRSKKSKDNYIKLIQKFERKCEIELIKTFSRIDIDGRVKTDPYSLPFNNEIIITQNGTGFANGFAFYKVSRKIINKLLEKDVYKLRFYLFINILTISNGETNILDWSVEYRFRYYI
jgi:hypothetical protein